MAYRHILRYQRSTRGSRRIMNRPRKMRKPSWNRGTARRRWGRSLRTATARSGSENTARIAPTAVGQFRYVFIVTRTKCQEICLQTNLIICCILQCRTKWSHSNIFWIFFFFLVTVCLCLGLHNDNILLLYSAFHNCSHSSALDRIKWLEIIIHAIIIYV